MNRALVERGLWFHPVTDLGAGSLPELADRVCRFLDQHPVWQDPTQTVHLLGHSAGGLLLRLAVKKLKRKPVRALTIASPHRGSGLAELIAHMPERYPGSDRVLRSLGYNVKSRKHFFDELAPEGLRQVFGGDFERGNLPSDFGVQVDSIVCSAPRSEWCMPLKMFYNIRAFKDFSSPSDGVVERDTQAFGNVIAELKIDHFRQMGLFNSGKEFDQLADVTAQYFRS